MAPDVAIIAKPPANENQTEEERQHVERCQRLGGKVSSMADQQRAAALRKKLRPVPTARGKRP